MSNYEVIVYYIQGRIANYTNRLSRRLLYENKLTFIIFD